MPHLLKRNLKTIMMQVMSPIITDLCGVQMFVCGQDVAWCRLHAILEVHTVARVKIRDAAFRRLRLIK